MVKKNGALSSIAGAAILVISVPLVGFAASNKAIDGSQAKNSRFISQTPIMQSPRSGDGAPPVQPPGSVDGAPTVQPPGSVDGAPPVQPPGSVDGAPAAQPPAVAGQTPEIDPGSATNALALLSSALLVIRGRRR